MRKVFSQYGTSYKRRGQERSGRWGLRYRLPMDGVSTHLCYQGKLVGVDPDDAEVGVVGVLSRHLLQDFQELITV